MVNINRVGLGKHQRIVTDCRAVWRTRPAFLEGIHHICKWQGGGDGAIIFSHCTQGIVVGVDSLNCMVILAQSHKCLRGLDRRQYARLIGICPGRQRRIAVDLGLDCAYAQWRLGMQAKVHSSVDSGGFVGTRKIHN